MVHLNVLIIYYSSTGTNYKLAQWAAEGARINNTEVKITKAPELAPQSAIDANPDWKKHIEETKHIPETSMDDIDWADILIFSIPTRYGNVPAQIKQLLDMTGPLWQEGKLKNKIVTAMSSAMNPHGGQEETILALYTTMFHWGAIVVTPGYTHSSFSKAGGNPYGTSVSVDAKGNMKEDVKQAVIHQAQRAIDVGLHMKMGEMQYEEEHSR